MRERTPREEFQKFRRKLLKENNIEHLICARCGEWLHSTHLHHVVELSSGGTNTVENLIPLCPECHTEWDVWDNGVFDFGTFLITPKVREVRKVFFGRIAISKQSIQLVRIVRTCVQSQRWAELYKEGEDNEDYRSEYRRQNEIFSAYPYSDTQKMLELYGDVGTPLVLEELSMLQMDGRLLNELKSKVAGW